MNRMALLAIAGLAMFGCIRKQELEPPRVVLDSYTVSDGVLVRMQLPAREYNFGEPFVLRVTARNMTDQPITITPTDDHQLYVLVSSNVPPPAERRPPAFLGTPWTLQPGETRVMNVPLEIGPEWRTQDLTKVHTSLSGLPDSTNTMVIWINPAGGGQMAGQAAFR